MMFCPNCGKENPQNTNFCAHCGKPLRAEPPPFDKQSLKEEKEREKLERKAQEEAEYERKMHEEAATELSRELRGLLSVPIDYRRNLIAPEFDLWRFATSDGRQFIKRAEGSAGISSVGTIIKGVVPCTHLIKNCGGLRIKPALLPFHATPEYINNFDAPKVYKQKIGWSEVTAHLNSDSTLESLLRDIAMGHESWTGGSYWYIPDDKKNPFTAVGQLVPQGDITLAALIFVSLDKGKIVKCVKALGRIAALISTLLQQGTPYGPAIGWGVMHDLRGDMEQCPGLYPRLREGWSLLARAHAVEAKVEELRRRVQTNPDATALQLLQDLKEGRLRLLD